MKKTFFLLSFVALLFAAIQTAEAQISLGIGSGSRVYTFQEGNAPAMPGAAPTISIEFEANFRLSRVFGVSVGADLAGNLISGDFHTTQITDNYKANPNLRRFDVMLGGGVGVEIIRHIRATVGYDHGLINRDGTPGRNVHTGALKVAAYYMF